MRVEFHRSAFKHDLDRDASLRGLEHALTVETDGTTTSEIIREALRRFLDVNQAERPQHA